MNLDEMEPTRFEDAGPEALRALVRSHQAGPTDAIVERMSERLDAALAAGAPASEGLGKRVERSFAPYKLTAVALAVASGLVLTWKATHPTPPESAIASMPARGAEPSTTEPVATSPVREPPSGEAAEAPATLSVHQLPSAPPPAAGAPSGTHVRARSGAHPDQGSSTELDLIQRAQTALASHPHRALAVTREHARAYPAGEFVQEREVIAVEALARLGRREEAVRRALALAHAFPNTPYATRLEKAIGRPISTPPAQPERAAATP